MIGWRTYDVMRTIDWIGTRKDLDAARVGCMGISGGGTVTLFAAAVDVDLAELCITSGAVLVEGDGPAEAFRLADVPGVAVVPHLAEGRKCARSWKISPAVGLDPQFPDVTPRDAQALREWEAMRRAAE